MQTHVSEQRQHLVVGRVVRDEEAQVRLVQDGGDSDQAGTAAGDDGNILPCVLAGLALAVVLVVHLGDGLAEGLDAGGRRVLPAGDADVEVGGPWEASLDLIFDLVARQKALVHDLLSRTPLLLFSPLQTTYLRSTLT